MRSVRGVFIYRIEVAEVISSFYLVDPYTHYVFAYHASPDNAGAGPRPPAPSGLWTFYPLSMTLVCPNGKSVLLSAKEMRLIVYLLARHPHPVLREDFIALLGGTREQGRRLDATIYRLRLKIKKITGLGAPFKTLYGAGYQNDGMIVYGRLPDLK